MTRPPIERYVRASIDVPGGSVEVGVQYHHGERLPTMRQTIRQAVGEATLLLKGAPLTDMDASYITGELERSIDTRWPDRGWFVELWCGEQCLTQVYAPCGMPRVR